MQTKIKAVDIAYRDLIQDVVEEGECISTRNSHVRRIFDYNVKFSSTPLVSLRKTPWKYALREWEWFMSGSDEIRHLHPSVHSWWKPWANSEGQVLFNYSDQFRSAVGNDGRVVDQIEEVIKGITEHPFSRRNVITTWNTADMTNPACPITNCHHSLTQFFVDLDNCLHLKTYQRSVDVIVGLPANWIQTWAFLLWLCHRTGRRVGTLSWTGGDVHIYDTHLDLAQKLLAQPLSSFKQTPRLEYLPSSSEFKADDFSLNSEYLPLVKENAEMVV